MSPAEEWKIILTEDMGAGSGSSGGGGVGGTSTSSAPGSSGGFSGGGMGGGSKMWGDIGKVAGAVAGVAGPLVLVIQALKRSKILSTFMDNFLMILGALVDLLLVPLIPLLVPLLTLLLPLMPLFSAVGKILVAGLPGIIPGIGQIKYIVTIVGDIVKLISDVVSWINGGFLKTDWDKIIKDLGKIWDDIVGPLAEVWKKISPYITDFLNDDVWPAVNKTIIAMGTFFGDTMNSVLQWFGRNAGAIINNNLPDWMRIPGVWKPQEVSQLKIPPIEINLKVNGSPLMTTVNAGKVTEADISSFINSKLAYVNA